MSRHQLRVVMVGSVDHGKSTLIGRLFHDSGLLPEGKLEAIEEMCRRRGVAFQWAFLMDAFQTERDQNVTIDSAQIWYRGRDRDYVIIDVPGHKEFLRNMITGAAPADAAVLLIAADEGVQEQSFRHTAALRLLGVEQVVVAVNKMDLVAFSPEIFQRIATTAGELLAESGITPRAFIPISAQNGQNILSKADETPWYSGLTLLATLEGLSPKPPLVDRPLRFAVQDIYRFDERRIIAGRIESGTLRIGDVLHFWPSGTRATVKTIESWNAPERTSATAGESIGIILEDQILVERGAIGTHARHRPRMGAQIDAEVFWLGRHALLKGQRLRLKLLTQAVDCRFASIRLMFDAGSVNAETSDDDRPAALSAGDIGEVIIETKNEIVYETFAENPALGRFVLVDDYNIVGGGVIRRPEDEFETAAAEPNAVRPMAPIAWIEDRNGSSAKLVARAIRERLRAMGIPHVRLDEHDLQHGLNADLEPPQRPEALRRILETAVTISEAGVPVLVSSVYDGSAVQNANYAHVPQFRVDVSANSVAVRSDDGTRATESVFRTRDELVRYVSDILAAGYSAPAEATSTPGGL